MRTEGNDGGMEPGDDKALWELLGRQDPVKASPFFSRRVLREVAALDARQAAGWLERARGIFSRVPTRSGVLWGTAVALLCAAGVTAPMWMPARERTLVIAAAPVFDAPKAAAMASGASPERVAPAAAPEEVSAQDVEVIADLDNLIEREESRLWTEDAARY